MSGKTNSPAIAIGVWVGLDNYQPLGRQETGAMAALPVWIDFMREALSDMPLEYFDIPDDVVKVHMDPLTGRLASDDSPHSVTALFKKGTEPRQYQ